MELLNEFGLSYFYGAWSGDGYAHVGKSQKAWGVSYSVGIKCMDKEIITRCYLEVNSSISGYKSPYPRATDYPRGYSDTMYIVEWNNTDFTTMVRKATGFKQQLPEYIWSAPIECRLAMLAGLMDTDGCIGFHSGRWYDLLFVGGEDFVREVPILFNTVGIETGQLKEKKIRGNRRRCWTFSVHIRSAINNGFYFRCRRKQYRLEQYVKARKISGYQYPHDIISDLERGGKNPTIY